MDRSWAGELFSSFWQAGFEGADHTNGSGQPLDMNAMTGHDRHCEEDYRRLKAFGIRTIRESIGWRLTDRGTHFDFSGVDRRAEAARAHGLQVLWTLCHYGWPDSIDIRSAGFVARFAEFCAACAGHLLDKSAPGTNRFYTPINEISFLSFAVAETKLIHPHDGSWRDQGYAIKQQLVRAAIAGSDAIRRVDPAAHVLHTDPLVHLVPATHSEALIAETERVRSWQFQTLDMLCGREAPHLGGHPRYLPVIGLNYYHSGQWAHPSGETLAWHLKDSRRRPLHRLLQELHERYGRPIVLAETSHFGAGRGAWIRDVAAEVGRAMRRGIPIEGVCLYPIIDRPDWEDPQRWHNSGLWDVGPAPAARRRLCLPYARDLAVAQASLPASAGLSIPREDIDMPDRMNIIVFSHLRWDFVFQRPQQLMSRFAGKYRVLFVEEPVFSEGNCYSTQSSPHPDVTVIRFHTPTAAPGFHDDQLVHIRPLLADILRPLDLGRSLFWFYTPMALPLAEPFDAAGIVYDCMDELRNFKDAPAQLAERENALLARADVVFTGGPSLYEARRNRHGQVHCFPSSVDAAHFGQALATDDHPDQRGLAHPRLGFFGVIDERFDTGLIAAIADGHPHWQLCLVGPVVKIDPASLPRRDNIHYFGFRSYDELPAFMAGWDVCLLPFARNDATRYISPTKTLEYMAGERPVVAVALPDIVELYGSALYAADTGAQFAAACEAALALQPAQRGRLVESMRALVAGTSWDRTVERMDALLAPLIRPQGEPRGAPAAGAIAGPSSAGAPERADCVILGAGPTGLSAAYHLDENTVLLERCATVGGNCRSITDGGYTFDCAGHIMFSNDDYVLGLYRILLGDNLHWQDREAWIYSKGVHTRYPFQGSLYGLPPKVLAECLIGAIEARFGTDPGGDKPAGEPTNFEEFIYRCWGAGVARHFAIPYNRKLWTVPLTDIETSWMKGRVPLPDLREMIAGAVEPRPRPVGPNARFGYPLRGGFQALMEGFLPRIKGRVELGSEVISLSPSKRLVRLADGRAFGYRSVISTLPLPELVKLLGYDAPPAVHRAARQLQHVSVRCVNLGVSRPRLTDKHWVYYPEDTVFHRIFFQGNASPHCNAPDGFGLTCEITYSERKPLPCEGEALIARCIDDCIAVGVLRPEDAVPVRNEIDIPYAYVVYDHARADNVGIIKTWLAEHGIISAGRYAEWEYYNSDHAFLAGRRAAEAVRGMADGAVLAANG